MAYRVIKREYPNGRIEYEVQKKILGLFWCDFNNFEEAKKAIGMSKVTTIETIITTE